MTQVQVDAPSAITLQLLHERYPRAFTSKVCVLPKGAPPETKFLAADDRMETIVSDVDRDEFERFLPLASRIFEFDPFARMSSAKLYPISMQLSCPESFEVSRPPEDVEEGESRVMSVMRISSDVHRELSSMVEQTCNTAALQGTNRLYVGQQSGKKQLIVLNAVDPPTVARIRALLGVEKIPEPEPSGPRSVTRQLIDTEQGQALGGFGRGGTAAFIPGGTIVKDLAIEAGVLSKGTRSSRITEACVELGVGVAQVAVGCTGIVAGTGISGTGGGAPVGVPVLVGSLVLTTAGTVNVCNSLRHLTIELWRSDDSDAMVSSSPPSESSAAESAPQSAKPAAAPTPAAATPAPKAEPAKLEPYKDVGGHHVPAKKAFEGKSGYTPGYDPNKALAISEAELKKLGVESHAKVTGAQRTRYIAFAKTGQPLTWEAIAKIETEALVETGMKLGIANATVAKAIRALKDAGVAAPVRIPWGK
jgi:hypothetical protein